MQTTRFEGQLVEAFVYGETALETWLARGREQRRPVLDRHIAKACRWVGGAEARGLAQASRRVLDAGSAPIDDEERGRRAYAVSALLDHLVGATDPGEAFALLAATWRPAGELSLLLDRRWLGTDKWLQRELRRDGDPSGLASWAEGGRSAEGLTVLARRVLDAAGGYLQDGYTRGERPPGL